MIEVGSVIIKEFPSKLDSASCRQFLREFKNETAESYRPRVVFDLSCVQHMNTHGVDLLLRCITLIAECDGDVKLAGSSPQTSLVLELTQMSEVVEAYDSIEEAVASWRVVHKPAPAPVIEPVVPAPVPQAA